jgi:hypothetical protein
VIDAVLVMRGYRNPSSAPRDVRDGVFRMLDRRGKQYDRLASAGSSAKVIAKVIQDSEWDRPTAPGGDKYESISECSAHGQSLADYRKSVNEMFTDLPPGPRLLLMRFAKAPKPFFDTPEGKQAVEKARELIKKEDGEAIAKKFDERLAIITATATNESVAAVGAVVKGLAKVAGKAAVKGAEKKVNKKIGRKESRVDEAGYDPANYPPTGDRELDAMIQGQMRRKHAQRAKHSVEVPIPGYGEIGVEHIGQPREQWYFHIEGGMKMSYPANRHGQEKMLYQLKNSAQVPDRVATRAFTALQALYRATGL